VSETLLWKDQTQMPEFFRNSAPDNTFRDTFEVEGSQIQFVGNPFSFSSNSVLATCQQVALIFGAQTAISTFARGLTHKLLCSVS
jgi:hypothetical protein